MARSIARLVQKTFYSPVNAQIKSVSFAAGDTVSKGTKLIEFEVKNLERDNQKEIGRAHV